jgi:hypothetical protein
MLFIVRTTDVPSFLAPFVEFTDWTEADKLALGTAIKEFNTQKRAAVGVPPVVVAPPPVLPARRSYAWVWKACAFLMVVLLAAGLVWSAMQLLNQPAAMGGQNCTAPPVVHKKFQKMYHVQTRMHAMHGGKPVVPPKSQDRNTLLSRIAAEEMYLNAKKLARNSTSYTETSAPFGGSWNPISLVYHAAKWVTMSASAVSLVIVMYSIVQSRQRVLYNPEP